MGGLVSRAAGWGAHCISPKIIDRETGKEIPEPVRAVFCKEAVLPLYVDACHTSPCSDLRMVTVIPTRQVLMSLGTVPR